MTEKKLWHEWYKSLQRQHGSFSSLLRVTPYYLYPGFLFFRCSLCIHSIICNERKRIETMMLFLYGFWFLQQYKQAALWNYELTKVYAWIFCVLLSCLMKFFLSQKRWSTSRARGSATLRSTSMTKTNQPASVAREVLLNKRARDTAKEVRTAVTTGEKIWAPTTKPN